MTGLIHELQEGASGSTVPIETLLRRMKLASSKLKLSVLENWVESELSGYKDTLPNYRIVMGNPKALNPYNGWIPIQIDHQGLMEAVSTVEINENISSLEDTLRNHTSGSLLMPMSIEQTAMINELANYKSPRMANEIQRGVLVSIISTVRNMILDWSIEMEKSGILGEGITFSATEKTQAKEAMTNIKIENFTGVLGSNNTTGDINSGAIIKSEIEEGLQKLNDSMPALIAAGADAKKLPKALKNIESEIAKKSPDKSNLKKFYNNANQAIVGASGSLIADGAKLVLSSLALSLGMPL